MKETQLPQEMQEAVMRLYREGLSSAKIAKELGTTGLEVRKHIATANSQPARLPKRTKFAGVVQVPRSVPDACAPICNATAEGIYQPKELNYRGKK